MQIKQVLARRESGRLNGRQQLERDGSQVCATLAAVVRGTPGSSWPFGSAACQIRAVGPILSCVPSQGYVITASAWKITPMVVQSPSEIGEQCVSQPLPQPSELTRCRHSDAFAGGGSRVMERRRPAARANMR